MCSDLSNLFNPFSFSISKKPTFSLLLKCTCLNHIQNDFDWGSNHLGYRLGVLEIDYFCIKLCGVQWISLALVWCNNHPILAMSLNEAEKEKNTVYNIDIGQLSRLFRTNKVSMCVSYIDLFTCILLFFLVGFSACFCRSLHKWNLLWNFGSLAHTHVSLVTAWISDEETTHITFCNSTSTFFVYDGSSKKMANILGRKRSKYSVFYSSHLKMWNE